MNDKFITQHTPVLCSVYVMMTQCDEAKFMNGVCFTEQCLIATVVI